MLRCFTRLLRFQPPDVKSKVIFSKIWSEKVKQGADPRDIDEEETAREAGLLPPRCVKTNDFVEEKERVMRMLEEQKMRRVARREAYLEWQAGQREKGAAHRLLRQSKKAEKYKRHHYHSISGRLLPISRVEENETQAAAQEEAYHLLKTSECLSTSEYLNSGSPRGKGGIFLTLRRN